MEYRAAKYRSDMPLRTNMGKAVEFPKAMRELLELMAGRDRFSWPKVSSVFIVTAEAYPDI